MKPDRLLDLFCELARIESPSRREAVMAKRCKAELVKSTWPGVSMIWKRYVSSSFFQKHVVAAAVMVTPRSCSWTIQSMVAAPSCTSPILCVLPV